MILLPRQQKHLEPQENPFAHTTGSPAPIQSATEKTTADAVADKASEIAAAEKAAAEKAAAEKAIAKKLAAEKAAAEKAAAEKPSAENAAKPTVTKPAFPYPNLERLLADHDVFLLDPKPTDPPGFRLFSMKVTMPIPGFEEHIFPIWNKSSSRSTWEEAARNTAARIAAKKLAPPQEPPKPPLVQPPKTKVPPEEPGRPGKFLGEYLQTQDVVLLEPRPGDRPDVKFYLVTPKGTPFSHITPIPDSDPKGKEYELAAKRTAADKKATREPTRPSAKAPNGASVNYL